MIVPVFFLPTNNIDDSCVIAVIDERETDDFIFSDSNSQTPYHHINTMINDTNYQRPDRSQYIFSNMGAGLNTIHSNNMITPIRVKHSLDNYPSGLLLANELGYKSIKRGIIVVDYFNIFNDVHTNMESIVKYYTTTSNLAYDDKVNTAIVNKIIQKKGRYYPEKISVRVVTFIPEDVLNDYGYVFLPASDITIAKFGLDNTTVNPNSNTYKKRMSSEIINNRNVIVIDIVDNESTNPYFIRIGNDTHRIFPSKDPNKQNGASLLLRKNDAIVKSVDCTLTDVSNQIGLYRTEKEVLTNGNLALLNENSKIEIEGKKIELEHAKINHEHVKLGVDQDIHMSKYQHETMLNEQKIKMGLLDIDKKKLDQALSYDKAAIEITQMTLKYKLENRFITKKHQIEMAKLNMDLGFKVLTILSTFTKWVFN